MQIPQDVLQNLNADLATAALRKMNSFRTLLFICTPGTISNAMAAAIESEFPWLSVRTVPDLSLALAEFENPVQLVLADIDFARPLKDHWSTFAERHPTASLALVGMDDVAITEDRLAAIDPQIVRGILPLSVNLDVFLSVLRIILKGGTYFPSIGYRPSVATAWDRSEGRPGREHMLSEGETPSLRSIDKLTKRENEILARIAMGNQNKIIAAALGLSEHTVKIHIHNIITKLGVHNRTEVVALYFEHKRKEALDARNQNPGQDSRSTSGDDN
ncbi:response regulator transcription factor [Rhizobium sp. LC145]|uniref:helix-turn-helix transcriptional regulator n=1 Tax=Rhizobium sp. LC145 TaxID=1120688 RepID=UPI000629E383|nr:response regulator transcription factor [Rhizobium sp. LC145]KKX30823.1 hypothetical protein YH62_15130 [Rhizobium sp. LC145]TKT68537.1 response regulator transcription factor [Rhizobiaceae bacterium LC148]